MALHDVPTGDDVPNDINVIIEVPAHSEPVKYEIDNYKDLEPGKWSRIDGWADAEDAKREIIDAVARYQAAPDKPAF